MVLLKNRISSFVGFISICVLVLNLLSCEKKKSEWESLPKFAPHEPYESPFVARKVLLVRNVYGARSAISGNSSEEQSLNNTQSNIVAVVDNTCLTRVYTPESNSTALSFYFYRHPERNPIQKIQYYSFALSLPMTRNQISDWVNKDECIMGISDESVYQTNGFNDPLYSSHQQSYLDTVNFELSGINFYPGNLDSVKVAVIDTGVGTHADLGTSTELPGVIHREDMRSNYSKSAPECRAVPYTNEIPNNTHGTFVGGIIAAKSQNSLGVVGVARNAQLISLSVGDCNSRTTTTEIGNAMQRALELGAEVVNISMGGATSDDPALRNAVVSLLNRKAVIVVSAGNHYDDLRVKESYPAVYAKQYPGFITVGWGTPAGKLEEGDKETHGSNFSPEHVKILAPGTSIASTIATGATPQGYALLPGDFGVGQGSSFSTPIVTGAVAMTIGFLKHNGLSFDEQMVEYLVTKQGARNDSTLTNFIRNGAVLDLSKLGKLLKYLLDSGEVQQPINISNKNTYYNTTTKQAEITFSATWNLEATHFGARIGLFDVSPGCNYSAPCLIQDFGLPSNSGSMNYKLSRNELLPMLPDGSDPDLNIYVAVAIYYRVPNGDGKFKNNFGLDAVQKVNVRDFDFSTNASPFYGEVTNLRTDQQYLYVQGWACLQGNNKPASVEMIDEAGVPLTTSFSYSYSLMNPNHSVSFDFLGRRGGPFVAHSFSMRQTGRAVYKSGLEGNPLFFDKCRTLTIAHGFEFGFPLKDIIQKTLQGKKFSIRATSPRSAATKIKLKDQFNQEQFQFPEVNFQETVPSNVQLTRGEDTVLVSGSLCSVSPSPIHVELSFSRWNLQCRLKKVTDFPNFSDPCSLSTGDNCVPDVYDSEFTDRNVVADYYDSSTGFRRALGNLGLEKILLPLGRTLMDEHIRTYPTFWPNATVSTHVIPGHEQAYFDAVRAKQFREVLTGDLLDGIQVGHFHVQDRGPEVAPGNRKHLADRTGGSVNAVRRGYEMYWDWYDVGEDYTPSIVAYPLDKEKYIGDYIFRTYRVEKLMREVKKYETPIGAYSQMLGNDVIASGTHEGGGCGFRFPVSSRVDNISTLTPEINGEIQAFLKKNERPIENAKIDSVALAMQSVPFDIRFFQDGVMILHLLSDFGSRTVPVETFGRGK